MEKIGNYFIKKWKKPIAGVLLSENDILVCLADNPADYQVDGLVFVNKEKVKLFKESDDSLFKKIMRSKVEIIRKKDKNYGIVNFESFAQLFDFIKSKKIFCEIQLSNEDSMFIGYVIRTNVSSVDIDFYKTNLKLLDNAYVEYDDITSVTIYSDYVQTVGSHIIRHYPAKCVN